MPYELSGKTVKLVVDPHAKRVLGVENDAGLSLGAATPLDRQANLKRVCRLKFVVVYRKPTISLLRLAKQRTAQSHINRRSRRSAVQNKGLSI